MRRARRPAADLRRLRGFTIVELVTVLVVSGILAVVVWRNVAEPVRSFLDVERRARLVDAAESALARMSREIRLALPNSIRISGGTALEFLRTLDGGRYRARPASGGAGDPLDFTAAADSFDVLGALRRCAEIDTGAGGQADCVNGTADCLVIYNVGQPASCGAAPVGANAWCGDNLAGIESAVCGPPVSLRFTAADVPGWSFPLPSPQQRFHVVDTPVSFVCAGGELRRYDDYPIAAAQSVPPPGAAGRLLADRVSACRFAYDPGTATRGGLVTLEIALTEAGETVKLLQQVHVPNVP